MSKPLSAHFSFEELTHTDHEKFQDLNRSLTSKERATLIYMARNLLEPIRYVLGEPMYISSGFRCKELNRKVGGVASSQHVLAQAADFYTKKRSVEESFDKIVDALIGKHIQLDYGQLILERRSATAKPSWIHVSLGFPFRDIARDCEVLRVTKDGNVAQSIEYVLSGVCNAV